MFSDALLKRFEDLPEVSPKEAESKYWAKPHVDYGCALKLAHLASGLDGDGADALRVAVDADEAAKAAQTKLNECQEEISRLCLELGVDPDQSLSDIVDSVVDLAAASDNGDGTTVDDADDPEGTPTGDVDPPTDADGVPKVPEGSQR